MFQPITFEQVQKIANQFCMECDRSLVAEIHSRNLNSDETHHALLRKLKILNWYSVLQRRAGLKTAHAMQRSFEPNTFVQRKGQPTFHSNKWSYYREGKHKPNRDLIDETERRFPGSAHEFDHPFWEAINLSGYIDFTGNDRLLKLGARISNAVFLEPVNPSGQLQRKSSLRRIANSISKSCDLVSLAAFTILTREAIEFHQQSDAHFWAKETYYMLIQLGLELHQRGIAYALIDIYRNMIFDWADDDDGFAFTDSTQDIVLTSAWLAILVYQLPENLGATLSWEKRVGFMKQFISDETREDVFHAMKPRLSPAYKISTTRRMKYELDNSLRTACREAIAQRMPLKQFPPSEISFTKYLCKELVAACG